MLLICEIVHLTRQIDSILPCPFFPYRDNRFKAIYPTSLKSRVDLKNNSRGLHWTERHVINAAGEQQQKSEYCLSLTDHLLHRGLFFTQTFCWFILDLKGPSQQPSSSSPSREGLPAGWEGNIPSHPSPWSRRGAPSPGSPVGKGQMGSHLAHPTSNQTLHNLIQDPIRPFEAKSIKFLPATEPRTQAGRGPESFIQSTELVLHTFLRHKN